MFTFPLSKMVGGIFYEHSHRLVASFVGLLTIVLALTFWLREERKWLRWLGSAALILVILQGILGGLRVVLLENTLAIVHAATAHIFFALTIGLVIVTSASWTSPIFHRLDDKGRVKRLCAATTALIYLQIVFGVVLRHTGKHLEAHLLFALLVAIHVILVATRVTRDYADIDALRRPALALVSLLLAQVALGGASYIAKFTVLWTLSFDAIVLITTLHLAVGALMLAASLALALRSYRLSAQSMSGSRSEQILAQQVSL